MYKYNKRNFFEKRIIIFTKNVKENCDSVRGERASGFAVRATRSFASYLSLPLFFLAFFRHQEMAARLQLRCNARICIRRWQNVVSKLRIRQPHGRGLRGHSFACYTLYNPRIQMITYVHTYRSRLPASDNGVVTGNHRIPLCRSEIISRAH